MDRSDQILELVERLLARSEYDVVDVETAPSKRGTVIRIFVDRAGGVTLDDCARVSRGLEDGIDAEGILPGGYVLEVSSPGVDRPLRRAEDFRRFAGERIRATTYEKIDGRTHHDGTLAGYDEETDEVRIEADTGETTVLPRGAIRKANLRRDPWAGRRRETAGRGGAKGNR
jgi:ribosome maturation factor RimP